MYLSKYCCIFSKTKLLNNFTILYSIANVNSTLSIINNVLLSKLKLSTFLDPHFIAVLIGLLKTSSALTVPNKSVPKPVAVFSINPNAISSGNRIITDKILNIS